MHEILTIIKKHEKETQQDGNGLYGLFNPFRRFGLTAWNVAFGMDWFRSKLNKDGSRRVDTLRAKKILEQMVKDELLIHAGSQRTLQAGSVPKQTYCTPEYMDWKQQVYKEKGI